MKLFLVLFAPGVVRHALGRGFDLLAFLHVVAEDLVLWSVAHVPDLALDIAEEWLEKFVLFLDYELIVEDSLHGVTIA